MRKIFVFIVLMTFLCSQKSDHAIEIIKVNPEFSEMINLSAIASNVDTIILETNESSLIARIQEVELTDQYLFINDSRRKVLQFDLSGKFIRQIGNYGRGPGEHLGASSISVDASGKTLYLASLKKILCYDFLGNLKSEINQGSYSEIISVIDNKLWTISSSEPRKLNDNTYLNIKNLIRYTLDGNPYDSIIVYREIVPDYQATVTSGYFISDLGDTQYLYYPVYSLTIRDTLFEVRASNLIPSIKLDFGRSAKPVGGKRQMYLRDIIRTNRYLFAEYIYKGKETVYSFDFKTKSGYYAEEGFNDDFFGTGIIKLKPLNLEEGIMYYSKDGFELVDKIEGISESSNPIIFIVKLNGN